MPEIKHNFTGGRMNKDLDERLVPNGEYRDAMNVQVSTSEGSDVGTVQNILGNAKIPSPILLKWTPEFKTIGSIADEKNDTFYWLMYTPHIDYILSYKRNDPAANIIFRDKNKNVLKFDPDNIITGINVIDDMLFWTDNKTEPKKINISRCKDGTSQSNNTHTKLLNDSQLVTGTEPDIEEKHITVIKKTPSTALEMKLKTIRDPSLIYTGVISTGIDTGGPNYTSFTGMSSAMFNFSGVTTKTGSNIIDIKITSAINSFGDEIGPNTIPAFGPIGEPSGLTAWHKTLPSGLPDSSGQDAIPVGTKIVFKPFDGKDDPPGLPVIAHTLKGVVLDAHPGQSTHPLLPDYNVNAGFSTWSDAIKVKIINIDGFPPQASEENDNGDLELKYVVDLFQEEDKLFEFKFPRFSYRYKYEDGEYSPFAPFTQVAFSPGSFDYHPRKGYNLGMTNKLSQVELGKFINDNTPKDVVSIDILFKDEPSPNVYIVDTISPNDQGGINNSWNQIKAGLPYIIDKETVSSVTPSNQMLRPWDNVPRTALAQDVTGNRIVYGNYVQNYDLVTDNDEKYFAEFNVNWGQFAKTLTETAKSIKSLREYQLGVVFVDKYGRETPVISNPTGTKRLSKLYADKNNRLEVEMLGNEFPKDLTHFKFFVKETSDQYYNMAMDRWYDAEDGNIWLAFPSSDRNKIDIDTFLVLKKGTDTDTLVTDAARYKVLAIENEAPDFIKTTKKIIAKIKHSLLDDNIFGQSTSNAPILGQDEFKMKYEPFLNTTGSNLATKKEDLYVEFAKEDQLSDRYKINSITNDWDGDVSADGNLEDAEYSVRLERDLKSDVNFISDDPQGLNISQIDNGAIVNIYEYKVENRPQFDGRFFVKIYKDEVFTQNISTTTVGDEELMVSIANRKIYGLKQDHISRHTEVPRRFHIDGKEIVNPYNPAKPNNWDESAGPLLHLTDVALGYYLDDAFSAFALYFRRYKKGNDRVLGGGGPTIKPLDYLQKSTGAGDVQYPPHSHANWEVAQFSTAEFGDYTGNPRRYGMTASFNNTLVTLGTGGAMGTKSYFGWRELPNYNPITGLIIGVTSSFNPALTAILAHAPILEADNPKETEVWFIDEGPREAIASSDDLNWGEKTNTGPVINYNVGANIVATTDNGHGIQVGGGKFNMEIGMGGIRKASIDGSPPSVPKDGLTEGFFNIGDWVTGASGSNIEYDNYNDFTDNFYPGFKFRWREDPDQTVYTINNVESTRKLRHSYQRNWSHSAVSGTQLANNYSIVSGSQTTGPTYVGIGSGTGEVLKTRPGSKAENLSFNFTKNWTFKDCEPNIISNWNPVGNGIITGGLHIEIPATNNSGSTTTGVSCIGTSISDPLIIYVNSLTGVDANGDDVSTPIHVGMALTEYNTDDGAAAGGNDTVQNHLGVLSNNFLVVRHIEKLASGAHALWLGGYAMPIDVNGTPTETCMAGTINVTYSKSAMPKLGENYTFRQVAMNGYSPNSEFNINTMGSQASTPVGAVGAVGYTLEFLGTIEPEEVLLSPNPAIFETEPKDVKDLDIYYEATGAIPMNFDASNVHDAFPIGTMVNRLFRVVGYDEHKLILHTTWAGLIGIDPLTSLPYEYPAVRPDGLEFMCTPIAAVNVVGGVGSKLEVESRLYNTKFKLPWHNCYNFGNGVESNRIRDNFNLTYIANGVKASTTLEQEYKKEHRKYGLIYSGLYNSTSGVNNLNQFIAAEKITKDINPIYGSIQKLHSRDTDLVTLCEDKCLRILANKDAVYNADGNSQLTATENVLGQTVPFSGEYGISTNPESFASESYRVYFTDKIRGTVMRLSKDGLTPISDHGMKDWFKDNLKLSNRIIGSHDDKKDEYNITLNQDDISKTVSFKEDVKGWVSFKSFTPENAISMANDYYTFINGELWMHHIEAEPRNNFYGDQYESSVTVVLNDNPGYIKEFNTLNYEGSQSKVEKFTSAKLELDFQPNTTYNDQEYYNLYEKDGWHVESIITNDEDGYIDEFLEKEGKWFNYIKRNIDLTLDKADTGDFSFQGIGFAETDYVGPDPCSFNYGFGLTAVNPRNTCVIYGGGILMAGGGDINLNLNNLVPVPPLQTAPWHFEIDLADGTSVYVGPTQNTLSGNYSTSLPTGDYIAHMRFDECPEKGNSIPFSVDCGACTSLFSSGFQGVWQDSANNAACDNGWHQFQGFTTTGSWTIEYYTVITPGQTSGGTLLYSDPTSYTSGQYADQITLPQGEYYFVRIDSNGCEQAFAFTIGCSSPCVWTHGGLAPNAGGAVTGNTLYTNYTNSSGGGYAVSINSTQPDGPYIIELEYHGSQAFYNVPNTLGTTSHTTTLGVAETVLFENLAPGSYNLKAYDINGCMGIVGMIMN